MKAFVSSSGFSIRQPSKVVTQRLKRDRDVCVCVARPPRCQPSVTTKDAEVVPQRWMLEGQSSQEEEPTKSDVTAPSLTLAYAWPRLLVLLVSVLWSSNFTCVRSLATADVTVAQAALGRFLFAAVALAPSLFVGPRKPNTNTRDRALPHGLLGAGLRCGLCISVGYVSQAIALQTTGAGKAAFVCSLAVIFVPFITSVFPGMAVDGKQSRPSFLAAAMAVLGVGVMELGSVDGLHVGDAWALGQVLGFGLGFIENERALETFPRHTLQLAAIQLTVVAAVSGCWATSDASIGIGHLVFPDVLTSFGMQSDRAVMGAIAYTGLITTAATIWLENLALVHVSASELSLILATEPLFASLLAALCLKESFGDEAISGGALILMAIVVSQLENKSTSALQSIQEIETRLPLESS